MLLLAAGTVIHDEVKVFITSQSIVLMNFEFIPSFDIFNLKESFENYAPQEWMGDLSYQSMSAIWNIHRILILIIFIAFIHGIVQIVNLTFNLKLNEKRKKHSGRRRC